MAEPSAASTRRPAARTAATAAAGSGSTATGRWNSEPTLARTAFGLYGSTESPASTTASAPAASAQRSRVPALPGSRTSAATTTSRGELVRASASGTSTKRQTATHTLRVDGVGDRGHDVVGDLGPRDVSRVGGVAQRGVPAGGGRGRVHLDDGGRGRERLAYGLRALGDEAPRLGAVATVLAQTPSRPDPPGAGGQRRLGTRAGSGTAQAASPSSSARAALTSLGRAPRATSTRAANAVGSLTARSASTRRSTSTPASRRPCTNRL